jgi:ribonuclease HI
MACSPSNRLSCVQFNAHHCRSAALNFSRLIVEHRVQVALVQEPYLVQGHPVFIPSGFRCMFGREEGKVTRSCIIVADSLFPRLIPELTNPDRACVQIITVEIQSLLLLSVYAAPGSAFDFSGLDLCLGELLGRSPFVCVSGDFNAHNPLWGGRILDERGEQLASLVLSRSLIPLNDPSGPPTFSSANGRSWIDVTLVSVGLSDWVHGWRVLDEGEDLSDHRPIVFFLGGASVVERVGYNYRKANWDLFQSTLEEGLGLGECQGVLQDIRTVDQLERAAELLQQSLLKAVEVSVPRAHHGVSRNPWWTGDLRRLRGRLRAAKRGLRRFHSPAREVLYRELKHEYSVALSGAKSRSWEEFCSENMNEDPRRFAYKVLCKSRLSTSIPFVRSNGVYSTSDEETSVLLLSNICKTDDAAEDTDVHQGVRSFVSGYLAELGELEVEVVTTAEVAESVDSCGALKAPGPDHLCNIVYKRAKALLIPILVKLFNASLCLSYFPSMWKLATVIFILKSVLVDPVEVKSYRPISLLCGVGKLLERIAAHRLTWFLESEHRLHPLQFGFRDGYSAEFAIDRVVSLAFSEFKCRRELLAVFLDISSAFDAAWHPSIVASLISLGCPSYLVAWVANYLSGRQVQVKLGGVCVSRKLERSCPQGGCLSPILWNCLLNDVFSVALPAGVTLQAYADDICVLVEGGCREELAERATEALRLLVAWGEERKLLFNEKKTEMMLFSCKRYNPEPVDVAMKGQMLKLSPTVRYLGVILDPKLRFRAHCLSVTRRARGLLTSLSGAVKKSWGLSCSSVLRLYQGAIRPILLYGCFAWLSALEKAVYVKMLSRVEGAALRLALNAPYTAPLSGLQVLAGVAPIQLFARYLAACTEVRWRVVVGQRDADLAQSYSSLVLFHESRQAHRSSVQVRVSLLRVSGIESSFVWYRAPVGGPRPPWAADGSLPVVVEPSRDAAREFLSSALLVPVPGRALVFTDGSIMASGCGSGFCFLVWSEDRKRYVFRSPMSFRLRPGTSIYQAELFAIRQAVEVAGSEFRSLVVCTDSLSSVLALQNPFSRDPLVLRVQEVVRRVRELEGVEVALLWVPGHEGVEGNEVADQAAKAGAMGRGEECLWAECTYSSVKRRLFSSVVAEWGRGWSESPTGSFTRSLFPTVRPKPLPLLSSLGRGSIFWLSRVLSGHFPCAEHLCRFRLLSDSYCRVGCFFVVESLEHYVCVCPRRDGARQRFRLVGLSLREILLSERLLVRLLAFLVYCSRHHI